eukprot:gene20685-31875_t
MQAPDDSTQTWQRVGSIIGVANRFATLAREEQQCTFFADPPSRRGIGSLNNTGGFGTSSTGKWVTEEISAHVQGLAMLSIALKKDRCNIAREFPDSTLLEAEATVEAMLQLAEKWQEAASETTKKQVSATVLAATIRLGATMQTETSDKSLNLSSKVVSGNVTEPLNSIQDTDSETGGEDAHINTVRKQSQYNRFQPTDAGPLRLPPTPALLRNISMDWGIRVAKVFHKVGVPYRMPYASASLGGSRAKAESTDQRTLLLRSPKSGNVGIMVSPGHSVDGRSRRSSLVTQEEDSYIVSAAPSGPWYFQEIVRLQRDAQKEMQIRRDQIVVRGPLISLDANSCWELHGALWTGRGAVAAKLFTNNAQGERQFRTELSTYLRVSYHPNIPNLLAWAHGKPPVCASSDHEYGPKTVSRPITPMTVSPARSLPNSPQPSPPGSPRGERMAIHLSSPLMNPKEVSAFLDRTPGELGVSRFPGDLFMAHYANKTPQGKVLVLEHLDGALDDVLSERKLGPRGYQVVVGQVVRAALHLHTTVPKGLVHGLINGSTVFVGTDGTVKLSAIEHARVQDNPKDPSRLLPDVPCNPCYQAPELLLSSGLLLPSADIFSIGCLAYRVITGMEPPLNPDDVAAALQMASPLNFKPGANPKKGRPIPDEWESVVRRCTDMDPKKRPTAAELMIMLEKIDEETCAAEVEMHRRRESLDENYISDEEEGDNELQLTPRAKWTNVNEGRRNSAVASPQRLGSVQPSSAVASPPRRGSVQPTGSGVWRLLPSDSVNTATAQISAPKPAATEPPLSSGPQGPPAPVYDPRQSLTGSAGGRLGEGRLGEQRESVVMDRPPFDPRSKLSLSSCSEPCHPDPAPASRVPQRGIAHPKEDTHRRQSWVFSDVSRMSLPAGAPVPGPAGYVAPEVSRDVTHQATGAAVGFNPLQPAIMPVPGAPGWALSPPTSALSSGPAPPAGTPASPGDFPFSKAAELAAPAGNALQHPSAWTPPVNRPALRPAVVNVNTAPQYTAAAPYHQGMPTDRSAKTPLSCQGAPPSAAMSSGGVPNYSSGTPLPGYQQGVHAGDAYVTPGGMAGEVRFGLHGRVSLQGIEVASRSESAATQEGGGPASVVSYGHRKLSQKSRTSRVSAARGGEVFDPIANHHLLQSATPSPARDERRRRRSVRKTRRRIEKDLRDELWQLGCSLDLDDPSSPPSGTTSSSGSTTDGAGSSSSSGSASPSASPVPSSGSFHLAGVRRKARKKRAKPLLLGASAPEAEGTTHRIGVGVNRLGPRVPLLGPSGCVPEREEAQLFYGTPASDNLKKDLYEGTEGDWLLERKQRLLEIEKLKDEIKNIDAERETPPFGFRQHVAEKISAAHFHTVCDVHTEEATALLREHWGKYKGTCYGELAMALWCQRTGAGKATAREFFDKALAIAKPNDAEPLSFLGHFLLEDYKAEITPLSAQCTVVVLSENAIRLSHPAALPKIGHVVTLPVFTGEDQWVVSHQVHTGVKLTRQVGSDDEWGSTDTEPSGDPVAKQWSRAKEVVFADGDYGKEYNDCGVWIDLTEGHATKRKYDQLKQKLDTLTRTFAKAVETDPTHPPSSIGYSEALSFQNQWDRAAEVLQECLKYNPSLAILHARLAELMHFHLPLSLDDAEAAYRSAIKFCGSTTAEHANLKGNLASLLAQRGAKAAALATFRESLAVDPSHANNLFNAGMFLRILGSSQLALEAHHRKTGRAEAIKREDPVVSMAAYRLLAKAASLGHSQAEAERQHLHRALHRHNPRHAALATAGISNGENFKAEEYLPEHLDHLLDPIIPEDIPKALLRPDVKVRSTSASSSLKSRPSRLDVVAGPLCAFPRS